ncbi:MAG: DNA polymerase III subunit delta [Alistipes sp.]|nr:DNA polymerase III subunit delta [Alistipes sp.]
MAKSSVSFRDSISGFTAISKDIRNGKFSPVYLLMGEEGYFIDRISDLLAESILSEEERAFNQIVVYGKDSECGDIINFCKQMPMMGAYQVVILKEAQQLRKIEQLSLYTQSPSATTVLVICHKEKNLDKRSALYKQINKIGVVFESVRPRDYEIGGWLSEFVRSKGLGIEPKALTMLTDHLGSDIAKISNELDKLVTYLPEGTAAITPDHIEQNIGISKDFNNFELTKAISERNTQRALLIAEHFSRNPKEHPLLVTISTLFSHFQRIFIINYQKWLARNRGTALPSDAELARMLKIPSAYFLNEYKQASALYPNKKVFVILGLLREYDMKSKGMNAGTATDGELLRELLLKIFLL